MNLHTIPPADLRSRPEFITFIEWCIDYWSNEWAVEIRDNEVWECERDWDEETDEWTTPEDGWRKWTRDDLASFLTDYRQNTGIEVPMPW